MSDNKKEINIDEMLDNFAEKLKSGINEEKLAKMLREKGTKVGENAGEALQKGMVEGYKKALDKLSKKSIKGTDKMMSDLAKQLVDEKKISSELVESIEKVINQSATSIKSKKTAGSNWTADELKQAEMVADQLKDWSDIVIKMRDEATNTINSSFGEISKAIESQVSNQDEIISNGVNKIQQNIQKYTEQLNLLQDAKFEFADLSGAKNRSIKSMSDMYLGNTANDILATMKKINGAEANSTVPSSTSKMLELFNQFNNSTDRDGGWKDNYKNKAYKNNNLDSLNKAIKELESAIRTHDEDRVSKINEKIDKVAYKYNNFVGDDKPEKVKVFNKDVTSFINQRYKSNINELQQDTISAIAKAPNPYLETGVEGNQYKEADEGAKALYTDLQKLVHVYERLNKLGKGE